MNSEPLIIKEEFKDKNEYEYLTYKNDAYQNSNIISKLFFIWPLKIIKVI